MEIKNLCEKRTLVANEIKAIGKSVETGGTFTVESKASWDALNKEYDDLGEQIEREKVVEQSKRIAAEVAQPVNLIPAMPRSTRLPAGAITNHTRNAGVFAWLSNQMHLPTEASHREAASLCNFDLGSERIEFKVQNSLKTFDGGTGGFAIDSNGFVSAFEKKLLYSQGMREAARVWNTPDGRESTFPQISDTDNTPDRWVEETLIDESDPIFSQKKFRAYDYGRLIKVSRQFMRDADPEAISMLGELLGESMARKFNSVWTSDSGADAPTGLINSVTVGKTTSSATAFTIVELNALVHSVDIAYRQSGCAFMMSDTTLQYIENLLDTNDQWNFNVVEGYQRKMLGYPIIINNDLPAMVAGAPSTGQRLVYFGQFQKFVLRVVGSASVEVLRERYAELGQIGLLITMATDSGLIDAGGGAVKVLLQA